MAMMENPKMEQKLQEGTSKKAEFFPITKLPVELQLQILAHALVHDRPIVVSGFTSTYSFAASPTPTTTNSLSLSSNLSTSSSSWSHSPLSILLISKHIYDLSYPLLFAHQINTFMFTTPPLRQWSYARDWYYSFMLDHSKETSAAMKRMSRVLFKCDGSMDNSLVGTALEYLPNMVVLTVDFRDFWGSPSARLEEEGRRGSGLGGFGGHSVLLPENERSDGSSLSPLPAMTSFPLPELVSSHWSYRGSRAARDETQERNQKDEFVSMVWKNVVIPVGKDSRLLKGLRFSSLKTGKGNWDEVVRYGESVARRKGKIEVDVEASEF